MARLTGRRIELSLPRRWIADLMRISQGMPVASIEREFSLPELAVARAKHVEPPSWISLFIKAYSLTAKRMPELRRSYQGWLFPHLFEADENIASIAVSREVESEPAVMFALLNAPENQSLKQITTHLQQFKTRPIEDVHSLRRLVRISRYPGFLRRILWWYGYNISGRMRAKTFGTFGVSVLGASGVTLLDLVFPLATTFTLGPISTEGKVVARLFFDHRVLDGSTATAAMLLWERTLNSEILAELEQEGKT
jgi:hypothetical protein